MHLLKVYVPGVGVTVVDVDLTGGPLIAVRTAAGEAVPAVYTGSTVLTGTRVTTLSLPYSKRRKMVVKYV